MYLFKGNTVVPVKILEYIKSGDTTDNRVTIIENVVANHYKTTVQDLQTSSKVTPARLMMCFLLFDKLHYGINGIANRYNIYNVYLKDTICDMYKMTLNDSKFFALVQDLRGQIDTQLQADKNTALNKVLFNKQ